MLSSVYLRINSQHLYSTNHIFEYIPVVPIDHEHLGAAVWVDRVVGEADLVPLPGGVHHILVIQVEEEGAHVLVIHLEEVIGAGSRTWSREQGAGSRRWSREQRAGSRTLPLLSASSCEMISPQYSLMNSFL